jgi:hypothetical protein
MSAENVSWGEELIANELQFYFARLGHSHFAATASFMQLLLCFFYALDGYPWEG